MRVLLAIVARERLFGHRRITAGWLGEVDRLARPLLPWGNAGTHYENWLAPSGVTAMAVWTNEPAPQPPQALLHTTHEKAIGFSGYTSLAARRSARSGSAQFDITQPRTGVFALLCADAVGLRARTSAAGAEPLYYATTRSHVFVGTRATIVHAVARSGAEPTYHFGACAAFIQGGFLIGEQMLLDNIAAVPPNTLLTVTPRTVREDPVPPPPQATGSASEVGKQFAEALVQTFRPLQQRSEPVRCAITGGRDSRLVLAGLKAAGVEVSAHTHGFAEHPDVKIGRQVAELLGVPHQQSLPAPTQADAIAVDPLQRVLHAITFGDGMVSAYENIALKRVGDHPWSAEPEFGGHGGGLYQGGYGRSLDDVTPDAAAAFLKKKFLRHEALVQKGYYQQHKKVMQDWIQRARLEPEVSLDAFYVRYRIGRWASGARSAYSVTRNLIQPFFDEHVMHAGRAGSVHDRLGERVYFYALQSLHEPLATYPFAGKPWRFQRQALPDRVESKLARESRSTFNWRHHAELRRASAEYILSHDIMASFLDLKAVTAALQAPVPKDRQLVWHLLTLTALLSNEWIRKPDQARQPIRIPLPTENAALPDVDVRRHAEEPLV